MLALAVLAIILLAAWFILVVAFKVTVGAIHLLLVAALVFGAIALVRRLTAGAHRTRA